MVLTYNDKSILRFGFAAKRVGKFAADMLIEKCVLIELKACRTLDPAHESQLLNYLRATEIEVGMLVNFGLKPQFKRFAFDNARKTVQAGSLLEKLLRAAK